MLTQSEREWLEQRASALDKYGCYSVEFYRIREVFLDIYGYKDAAEFEARVAAKLAEFFKSYIKSRVCADLENSTLCPGWPVCTEDVSKPHPPHAIF